MAKLYRVTDKLPIKIGDITFKISPLTFEQRSEVQADLSAAAEGDMQRATDGTFKAIKYAVKSIEGIETYDGSEYELDFDGKFLSDVAVNDLLNLEIFPELARVATSLINGVPDSIDDEDGKPVKGISLLYKKSRKGKTNPN